MWVVLASVTLMSPVLAMMPKLESSCETVANRIHITKEEFSKAKELMRTCEEDIELMKCEGSCVSSTMPSAMDRLKSYCKLFVIPVISDLGSAKIVNVAERLDTMRRL